MTTANLNISYDDAQDTDNFLINDLAANGNLDAAATPQLFVRAVLRGLIAELERDVEAITVNTSCMQHIDALEATGFEIVEEYSENHFVVAEYTYPDE